VGCGLAVVGAPLVGLVALAATDSFALGFATWAVCFSVPAVWSVVQLVRAVPREGFTPVWSFNPVGASAVAATDVVALTGDASAAVTGGPGYALVVPVALLAAGIVLVTETWESGRFGQSLLKAVVAFVLVMIPTPVAGLVGGVASLGHRLGRPGATRE
jgi:hypothetical protein